MNSLRYVIPLFDGDRDINPDSIKAVLLACGAERIRVHKGFGVYTFALPSAADNCLNPALSQRIDNEAWLKLSDSLKSVHPNCVSWGYSKLDRATCDRRRWVGMEYDYL